MVDSTNNSTLQIGAKGALVTLLAGTPIAAIPPTQREELVTMNRKLCMHITATNPLFLHAKDAPAALLERETAIFE